MKKILLLVLAGALIALTTTTSWGATGLEREVHLAVRTDGVAGTGTATDPYDVSTAAKLDTFSAGQISTYYTSPGDDSDHAVFYFAPGAYQTSAGLPIISNWRFEGAGQNVTTIQATPVISGGNMYTGFGVIYSEDNLASLNIHDASVNNMTVDGGVKQSGAPLAASFTMPASGSSVTVTVMGSTSYLLVASSGPDNCFVQDTDNATSTKQWYGTCLVTNISGTSMTLKNNGGAIPGTVVSTAYLYPATHGTTGIFLCGSNVKVENVTVQNCCAPFYEGCDGIFISPAQTGSGIGNVVNKCTVKNLLGAYGTSIGVGSFAHNNGVGTPTGTFTTGSKTITVSSSAGMVVGHLISAGSDFSPSTSIATINSGTSITLNNFPLANGTGVNLSTYGYGGQENISNTSVTNNVVQGNGTEKGIGSASLQYATITGNYVSNVTAGYWNDFGYCQYIKISGNHFSASADGIYIANGSPNVNQYETVSNNTITITTTGATGINLGDNTYNCQVTDNNVGVAPGVTGGNGIVINTASGTFGNAAIGNEIVSVLANNGSESSGMQLGNYDEKGDSLSLGLSIFSIYKNIIEVSQSSEPAITLTAAQAAAINLIVAGAPSVTINVWDGTFSDKNLGSNNINWVFYPSATINVTGANEYDAIFELINFNNGSYTGFGQTFSISSTTGGVDACRFGYVVTAAVSNLNFNVVGAGTDGVDTAGVQTYGNNNITLTNANFNVSASGSGHYVAGISVQSYGTGYLSGSGNFNVNCTSSGNTACAMVDIYGRLGVETINWNGDFNISSSNSGSPADGPLLGDSVVNVKGNVYVSGAATTTGVYATAAPSPVTIRGDVTSTNGPAFSNSVGAALRVTGQVSETSPSNTGNLVTLSGDTPLFTSTGSPTSPVSLSGGVHDQWLTWTGTVPSSMTVDLQADTATRIGQDVAITSSGATTVTPSLGGATFYPSSVALSAGGTLHLHKLAANVWSLK